MTDCIDLNADLAEGGRFDQALLQCVSSANISCGWHAGELSELRAALDWAGEYGVAIGAHPGFADKAHFGRRELHLPLTEIYDSMLYQLGALQALCQRHGQRLQHVKPHGALYNMAAANRQLADTLVQAIQSFDPELKLIGLAHSALIDAAHQAGLKALAEGFADRAYLANGQLAPRSMPGAIHSDLDQLVQQSLSLISQQPLKTLDGGKLSLNIDSLCLHGDSPHALQQAQRLCTELTARGIAIKATGPRLV